MNWLRDLRYRFDMWRRDRLDRKLLRIRQRYEDASQYEIAAKSDLGELGLFPGTFENEEQWVKDSALFVEGDAPKPKVPIHFKMSDVAGIAPNLDTEKYNEALLDMYGPVEGRLTDPLLEIIQEGNNAYKEANADYQYEERDPKDLRVTINTPDTSYVRDTTPCKENTENV